MTKKILSILFISTAICFNFQLKAQNPDAAVEEIVMPNFIPAGTNNVNIKFKNAGTSSYTGITLNWSIDGGATVNSYSINFPFAPGLSLTSAHGTQLTVANPGTFVDLKVWTSNPGGMTDVNTSNDTLIKRLFVATGVTVPRHVVVEQFTTTQCPQCTDGKVAMDQLLSFIPNVIGIGVHSCFGTDAMTNATSTALCNTIGNNSAPMAMVDRILYPGNSKPAFGRNLWLGRANTRSSERSPVDITVHGYFTPGANTATITVSANFVDFPEDQGNLNVSLAVLEDSITRYPQSNAYNGTSGHPYQGRGNPVVGFIHRNVLRGIYPSTFGDATVIPASIAINTPYTKTYTINMSTAWNLGKISFVGMVNYDGTGSSGYEIVNARKVKITDLTTGIENTSSNLNSVEISPNPTSDYSYVNFRLANNSPVSFSLYNITGKLVQEQNLGTLGKGKQQAIIDASALDNGFYILNLKVGGEQITRKVSVIH